MKADGVTVNSFLFKIILLVSLSMIDKASSAIKRIAEKRIRLQPFMKQGTFTKTNALICMVL